MERVAVELGVHGDRGDAELAAGADDPDGDLAPVGDQDLVEHRLPMFAGVSSSGANEREAPGPRWPVWRVTHVDATGSTNADLLAEARAGAPAGLVRVAAFQSAGRGRMGRVWEASPGDGLLVSVLLRPDDRASELHRLTQAVALAAPTPVPSWVASGPI